MHGAVYVLNINIYRKIDQKIIFKKGHAFSTSLLNGKYASNNDANQTI